MNELLAFATDTAAIGFKSATCYGIIHSTSHVVVVFNEQPNNAHVIKPMSIVSSVMKIYNESFKSYSCEYGIMPDINTMLEAIYDQIYVLPKTTTVTVMGLPPTCTW